MLHEFEQYCTSRPMIDNWVTKRLLELDLSPEEFAAQLGCSIGTVHNLKRGKTIRLETAYKAAKILGVEVSLLISRIGETPTRSSRSRRAS